MYQVLAARHAAAVCPLSPIAGCGVGGWLRWLMVLLSTVWLASAGLAQNLPSTVDAPIAELPAASHPLSKAAWHTRLQSALTLREQGHFTLALELLDVLAKEAQSLTGSGNAWASQALAQARGEAGIALVQSSRLELGEQRLAAAIEGLEPGTLRARYRLFLAMALAALGDPDGAAEALRAVETEAREQTDLQWSARLQLVRLGPPGHRLDGLHRLGAELEAVEPDLRGSLQVMLASVAQSLGPTGTEIAWRHYNQAATWALARSGLATQGPRPDVLAANGDKRNPHRVLAESWAGLSELYEGAGRTDEAIRLVRRALPLVNDDPVLSTSLLGAQLETRLGRLLVSRDEESAALAAYQRAVQRIEQVRPDLPIEDLDGRSTYTSLLQPAYLGLAEQLIRRSGRHSDDAHKQRSLAAAVEAIELLRQSEMQDFLGDRCAVAQLDGGSASRIVERTAALYTLTLPDRLELLLKTRKGVIHRTVKVSQSELHKGVNAVVERMRGGSAGVQRGAAALYRWLWAPVDEVLQAQGIENVVVLPDGVLRLLPFSALHDGRKYVVERYAVSTATGLTMTNAAASTMASSRVLITGMSTPGRVVEKLSGELVEMVKSGESGVAQQKGSRKLRQVEAVSHPDTPPSEAELQKMRDELKLPGVKDEVRALREVTQGTVLLDEAFTVNRLQTLAETGEYRVIHVASHGMFGGSAETSFIMAHDDIVNSNQLQTLLQTPRLQKTPIELLALSACQTAEGNDRAPLGISGVAIRARAKTVLGTLWPVADEAARQLMADFYRALRQQGLSKTQALRQAQLQLIKDPKLAHPMFWSPFVLIGNWQ